MKPSAFLIRLLICWGLSLIPLPEQEAMLLEERLRWLGEALPPGSLKTLPFAGTATLSFLYALATGIGILSSAISMSALLVPLLGSLILIGGYQALLATAHLYVPMLGGVIAILASYLVFTGYLQAVQENRQWRSLKEAQYLRELDQMKTNFLTLVSHDLKTPIAKIQAMVERLRRDEELTRDQRQELLDSIETSNQELRHFISSVLHLSRIESQKVILQPRPNDLNRTIQQTIRRFEAVAAQKQLTLEEDLEPLFSFEYDEELVKQVLGNLIDNAIRYSPNESRVIVRSRETEGAVQVDVQDFGKGIPNEQLPHMFTKFYRFKRPLHEKVKGTGLGLYLSKYFIELHGGTIRLKTLENGGTTFSFTLPLRSIEGELLS
jgi:hypothetical protein